LVLWLLLVLAAPGAPALDTLPLHDALPILGAVTDGFREAADTAGRPSLYRQSAGRLMLLHAPVPLLAATVVPGAAALLAGGTPRSEEHTSELQSRENLVCRLLPEKKNNYTT